MYKDINDFALQILLRVTIPHVKKEKKSGNEDFPEEMSFGTTGKYSTEILTNTRTRQVRIASIQFI